MTNGPRKRPHGQMRRNQVVTTFGPGSLLDLPHHSVLVAGLDHWLGKGEELFEERLSKKLQELLGVHNVRLFAPPPEEEDFTGPRTGITVWQFPEWFVTQDVRHDGAAGHGRSRRLVNLAALHRGKFVDEDKKPRHVVPIRFVRACPRGHIGDINWREFVSHKEKGCKRPLWVDERGTSGDLSEVWIRCECDGNRRMSDATKGDPEVLGFCDGARPWLGSRYTAEKCSEINRLLIRTASNSYFPQLLGVISLPDVRDDLMNAVNQVWESFLQYAESAESIADDRARKPPVKEALKGFSDKEVWDEVRRRKEGGNAEPKPVKQVELETLLASKEEIGNDKPEGNFYARTLPRDRWEKPWTNQIDRVVLVHRLREVVAQVGFTRFEALGPDVDGELEMGVERATLAREVTWLPAVENKGEGVFISLRPDAIQKWASRPEVKERGKQLNLGCERWGETRKRKLDFPGAPYVMVHSLSHLLITAISLECGYPASSLRERVYWQPGGSCGILIYTGSPDAEGTLGGLVESARAIARHLRSALEMGELCSNDPVCAQHSPEDPNERRFLQGAACHGCLLIAETCCEQYNNFLDRALVVPTLDSPAAAFFQLPQ